MGTVDLFHSRRTAYQECKYWIRNNTISPSSEYVLKNTPSGTFFAKEISPQYNQFNNFANGFSFNKDGITLVSDDDLHEITVGSIVLYNNKAWNVDNVQKEVHRKETEFNIEVDYKYYLTLRR